MRDDAMWPLIAISAAGIAGLCLLFWKRDLRQRLFGGAGLAPSIPPPPASSTMDILQKATVVKVDRTPRTFAEALGDSELIALYFSAHWCPPCRMFTPVLANFHKQLKQAGKKFEVIFVSSDHNEEEMYGYMKESHGDWYAVKYDDPHRRRLSSHFHITGIPMLVILNKSGKVVAQDARSDVQGKGSAAWDEWIKA